MRARRPSLFIVGSLLGMFVAARAYGEEPPAAPPDTPKAPDEAKPSEPPPEPAPPPPAEPPPAPPAAPPAKPPPAAPPVEPPPAPVAAPVTLEETPEEAPKKAAAPGAPAKKKHPKKLRHPKTESHAAAAEPAPAKPPAPRGKPEPKAKPAREPASDEAEEGDDTEDEGDESKENGKGEKPKEDDGEGLLGPFRIGGLVGVGLPGLLTFGGIIKLTRYLAAGLNIGLVPAIKLSLYGQAELSYQEYDLYGRLFPFGGSLFVGAGVGYASIAGSFKSKYDVSAYQNLSPVPLPNPLSIDSEGSVRTLVLTPAVGLLHTFGSGFTLGVDIGAQIPIAPSQIRFRTVLPATVPQEVTDKFVKPNDQKVRDTLDTVGRTILPTLNLRVGWLI